MWFKKVCGCSSFQIFMLASLLTLNVLYNILLNCQFQTLGSKLEVLKQVLQHKEEESLFYKNIHKDLSLTCQELENNFQFIKDCCIGLISPARGRYRRSADHSSEIITSENVGSHQQGSCEKGEKGAKGVRGPPGLPGVKGEAGESGRCECLETTSTTTTTPAPTIEPRQHNCRISIIGIPLYQGRADTYWGFWMKDTYKDSELKNFYWLTTHFEGNVLYAYESLEKFKSNQLYRSYDLPEHYSGTNHVVFNGSFIYQKAGSNEIVMFNLEANVITASVILPSNSPNRSSYLYYTNYTYFDIAVDENGLWVIYTSEDEPNSLLVSNLNFYDLTIRVTWNVPVRPGEFGESFIVCGKLYLIRNTTTTRTMIDSIYDLYLEEWTSSQLRFNNPYELNTMVSYNPSDKKIYSWDKGYQLVYSLLID